MKGAFTLPPVPAARQTKVRLRRVAGGPGPAAAVSLEGAEVGILGGAFAEHRPLPGLGVGPLPDLGVAVGEGQEADAVVHGGGDVDPDVLVGGAVERDHERVDEVPAW